MSTPNRVCLNCEDWRANIEKVNGPLIAWSLRSGGKSYDGKPFRFCPWCGAHLSDVSEDQPSDV